MLESVFPLQFHGALDGRLEGLADASAKLKAAGVEGEENHLEEFRRGEDFVCDGGGARDSGLGALWMHSQLGRVL